MNNFCGPSYANIYITSIKLLVKSHGSIRSIVSCSSEIDSPLFQFIHWPNVCFFGGRIQIKIGSVLQENEAGSLERVRQSLKFNIAGNRLGRVHRSVITHSGTFRFLFLHFNYFQA